MSGDIVLLKPTNEPGLIVGRAKDGMGWCRFDGPAALSCGGCLERVSKGYMARAGGDYRCESCVQFVDEHMDQQDLPIETVAS